MAFQIGQRVVCVMDDPMWSARHKFFAVPEKGKFYTIRELVACPVSGRPAVRLGEINNPCGRYYYSPEGGGDRVRTENILEPFFWADCFRPLIGRKVSTETGFSILDDIRKRESGDEPERVKAR